MVDKFITIAAAFDWITPTVAFIQDFIYGPVSDFSIPARTGWNRRNIKRLLKKGDIRVWGFMLNQEGDMLMFTVPQAQAHSASISLQQEGIPILYTSTGVFYSS